MNGMVDYIFGSLHTSRKALCAVRKTLKNQRQINVATVVTIGVLTVNILVIEATVRAQEKEIDKLRAEIENLKENKE